MTDKRRNWTRRGALSLIVTTLVSQGLPARAATSAILVHKNPNCSCCSGWVRHLQGAGFTVAVQDTDDLGSVRKRLRVPGDLAACHTAEVDGYVLEGHVPAIAVKRLLEKRPQATGLAVPGMPVGSPGMEGGAAKRYDVVLFGPSGREVFMHSRGAEEVS